ncbi:MAG: alpha/beta hydrolase, partial [Chloroflexota bacterium]
MDELLQPIDEFVDLGFQMHIRRWNPASQASDRPAILLVHGLSSNAKTWDAVGRSLAEKGFQAVAVDQRSHGLSDAVAGGYDFATVTADLNQLLDYLGWQKVIMVGQSWGGNVMLSFGTNYPNRAVGLVFVDGGFLNVGGGGEAWEEIYERLMPPPIDGVPIEQMARWMRDAHPDWSEEGIAGTLGNFKHSPDGILSRKLPIPHHMEIVRHLFEQDPITLYPQIEEPVLIYVA